MNIIISDVHLGTKKCQVKKLKQFLTLMKGKFDNLILNGDILDIERLNSKFSLPKSHLNILYKLEEYYNAGKLIYVRGNHELEAKSVMGIPLLDKYLYTSGGKSIYVLHGHTLGGWALPKKVERYLDDLYSRNSANRLLNWVRESRLNYMVNLGEMASSLGTDKVLIGHSHTPDIKWFNSTLVCNSGDWVHPNHCTWLCEVEGHITLKYFNGGKQ